MKKLLECEPTFTVSPGAQIPYSAKYMNMTLSSVAEKMGIPLETLDKLMNGDIPITLQYAESLEKVLDVPAHTWLSLESGYRRRLEQLRKNELERKMKGIPPYVPDMTEPPGEMILEKARELGMPVALVAEKMGLSRDTLDKLIKGEIPLTARLADGLQRVLGVTADIWIDSERSYRRDLLRIKEAEEEMRLAKKAVRPSFPATAWVCGK